MELNLIHHRFDSTVAQEINQALNLVTDEEVRDGGGGDAPQG
jgi:hypothetical protein